MGKLLQFSFFFVSLSDEMRREWADIDNRIDVMGMTTSCSVNKIWGNHFENRKIDHIM